MRCYWLLCLGFLLAAVFSTEAAQLTINVGTAANDGSGDTIRQAFQKVNTNFTEVYSNIANINVSGGGSNYLFDTKQFTASSGGTNVAIKVGAAQSNIVFYPDAGGVAWSVADSSQVYITNSIGHLLNSSWIFQGISTLGMDSGAVIYDYPGTLKQWNFKATADANTVARVSDINGATNGMAPLKFDGTQFSVSQSTNITGASGIQLTNVDANNVTNRGASTLVGAVEARGAANITGAVGIGGTLTATGAVVAASTANITGASFHGGVATFTNGIVGQSSENLTGALGVGGTLTATGAVVAASTVNVTGASTHGGAASFTNGVQAQSTVNITGASFHGGVATFTNTIVGQVGENLTGALGVGGTLTATGAVVAASTANITGAVGIGGNFTATNPAAFLSTSTNTGAISARRSTNYSDSASIAPLASIGSTNLLYGPSGGADGKVLVSDAQGHGRWGSVPASTNIMTGGILYLDALNGNDSTAARGNKARPFLTWTNAVAAIQDNDRLEVLPGRYWTFTKGSPSQTPANSNGPNSRITGKTNIVIVGIGQPVVYYTNVGTILQLWGVTDFLIDGLTFECTNKAPNGSYVSNLVACVDVAGGSARGTVQNCKFLNPHDHGITPGIAMVGSRNMNSNVFCFNDYFYNLGQTNLVVGGPNGYDGTGIAPATGWWVENCYFERCLRGVEVQTNDGFDNFWGGGIINCIFRGNIESPIIFIGGVDADAITDWLVSGNQIFQSPLPFDGSAKSAIALIGGGTGWITIDGNQIDERGNGLGYGINASATLAGGMHDIIIENNVISGNGSGVTAAGISVAGTSVGITTNCFVSNNRIKVGDSATWGIVVHAGGTTINLNDITMRGQPANLAGIGLQSSTGETVDNKMISNVVKDSGTYSYYVDLGSSNNFIFNNYGQRHVYQCVYDLNPIGFNTTEQNWNGRRQFNGTNELGPMSVPKPLFNQWAAGSVTNDVTTSITSLLGQIDGSQILEPGFFTRNKTIVFSMRGQYWNTNAASSSARMFAYLDAGTTSNVITQSFFPIPGALSGGQFNLEITATCMTNGTGGAIMADGLMNGTNIFTNTVTVMDVTKQYTFRFGVTNSFRTNGWRTGTGSLWAK
jgi:hypothetical protein